MKSTITVLFLFYGFYNCSTIDVAVPNDKKLVGGIKNAAIRPLEVKTHPKMGEDFADSLGHHFVKSNRIHIVSRSKSELDTILGEQKAARTAIYDEESAPVMGKLKGVDVIFIGNGETIDVDSNPILNRFRIKVIDVNTGVSVLSVNKEPGIEWTPFLVLKYVVGLGLVWDKKDMLVESSNVNHLSEQTVKSILNSLEKVEKTAK
jgi:hypothetical protein